MQATTTSAGFDRLDPTMLGSARQASHGKASRCAGRIGTAGSAGLGLAAFGTAWHCRQGKARPGEASQASQAWPGQARQGRARQGTAGKAWHGWAGLGLASQAWLGQAWPGEARHRRQGRARQGQARHGVARQGVAPQARRGRARRGTVWPGVAPQAWHGTAGPGVAGQDTNREGESGVQMAPNFSPYKNMTNTKQMTAADAIREIAEIHGHVTPQLVVDAAKPKESPLHNNFEWNNTKAAAEFRLIQAAHLIRKIKVTIEASEDHKVSVRQFVNVAPINDDEPTSGLYVTVQDAMEVTSYREQLLNQCRRDIVAFKTKYAALTEAASIIKAMDKLKP